MSSIATVDLRSHPRQSMAASNESAPSPPLRSKRTPFRLVVTGVHPDDFAKLERALRTFSAIEWVGFCYDPAVETMRIGGMLPCGPDRAVDVYLPQLTFCAWDIVCVEIAQVPSLRHPEVVLLLNPNERDEQVQSLQARQFSQYKRRRREFEACGGDVRQRWGLAPVHPPPEQSEV